MKDEEAQSHVLELIETHGFMGTVELLGVNKGHVSRAKNFATYSPTLRKALGLHPTLFKEIPVCMECGEVHQTLRQCAQVRAKTYRKRYRHEIRFDDEDHLNRYDALLEYMDMTPTELNHYILMQWENGVMLRFPSIEIRNSVRQFVRSPGEGT